MSQITTYNEIGHWVSKVEIPVDTYGFIYSITNCVNNKVYIGKKQILKTVKRKPLKGRKNKRHFVTESDWKTYTGSCNELNNDIDKHGKDKFKFEIIKLCNSKWELSYHEAKMQFDNNVLLDEKYYNGIINLRIGKVPNKCK